MEDNTLTIYINKPIVEVFNFTITPPNSTLWLPSVLHEEVDQWPIQVGTIYTLTYRTGGSFVVRVSALKKHKLVEWTDEEDNYHCRYTYGSIDDHTTKLQYYEWVDSGRLDEPLKLATLEKLKRVIEKQ